MRRIIRRTCWVGSIVVAIVFGHWLAIQVSSRSVAQFPQRRPTLPIEATSTQFGEVLEDSDFAWTVRLRNTGPDDIEVEGVNTSCDCLQATPASFRLPGGGEVALKLRIDLTRRGPGQLPGERGRSFQTSIRLSCKRGGEAVEHQFAVGGVVRDVLAITAADLDLGEHSILSLPLKPFQIQLKSAGPHLRLVEASAIAESGWRACAAGRGSGRWYLELAPPKTLFPGVFEVPASLRLETADGPTTRRLVFQGRLVEDIELWPATVALLPVKTGAVSEETLLLKSHTGRPLRVTKQVADKDAQVIVGPVTAGGRLIVIRQKVSKVGRHEGSLTLEVVDEAGRESRVNCRYWYYGR